MTPHAKLAFAGAMFTIALILVITGARLVFMSQPIVKLLGGLTTDGTGTLCKREGKPRDGLLIFINPPPPPPAGKTFGTELFVRKDGERFSP